ncbi:Glyoxylase, beta-lactamase superfamily II [Parafrankia irregularis]|uniref:Glyoxylase, beta-lactamase superfamily II n=1 Tax=Parafrankia irregularis TaxID=795642 RepID=A0A0S4QDV7_9ACTN|nr:MULTISPECIES: MBL fold metallo-hydrolase [Parafrankia]MBE3199632.1 MBL fold metallo-hydrolase [Parafrankia sp. CH37]CUU53701.1 Glyoxylase, beta-lactamase superfamily II [Parafrankia irregularis]
MSERLYFRQLLSGRDFAVGDPAATQMVNFVYLIGDRETREAVVVDPAYRVGDLLDILAADDMRLTGALVTHHHADHVGGTAFGIELEGIRELLERTSVPIHLQRDEAEWVRRGTGVGQAELVEHADDDVVTVGAVDIRLLHTPGHTPGSQCFLVDGRLVAGDTLFLEGCGRMDFPGGDAAAMYDSLRRLGALADDVTVYPGHRYSAESSAELSVVRKMNYVFRPTSSKQWLAMLGA